MKLYCPTCGAGTNYSLEKPKFCASCGKSFSVATRAPLGKVAPQKQANPVLNLPQEYEEEEENEWVRQEQEEAQRLHERGYCQRCIRHTVNREGGQPVKGCPSCDIKLCNGLLHI